jgi:hypothetical protein
MIIMTGKALLTYLIFIAAISITAGIADYFCNSINYYEAFTLAASTIALSRTFEDKR